MATATPHTPGETTGTPESPTPPRSRFREFKERHHIAFELAFFFGGFLFDVVLLHRIDSTPLLIHQASYLFLSVVLIAWDHRIHVAGEEPRGVLGKIASVRLWLMHFLLGTLLNAFMVFYFRSSSGVLRFGFLAALALLIVLNEIPEFRKGGPIVRVALLSFCVTSFLAYLIPVVVGSFALWQYPLAALCASGITVGAWKAFRWFTNDPRWTFSRAVLPGLVIQVFLLGGYMLDVIPPVPLSLKHIGLYTNVTRTRDERGLHYDLEYQKSPPWVFWRRTNDQLVGPPETRAYAFIRLFAPTRFHDQVKFQWEYDDPKRGWTPRGAPFSTALNGGNEEGYRTLAYSTLGPEGTYRVRVLTAHDREIGRMTFDFKHGEAPEPLHDID